MMVLPAYVPALAAAVAILVGYAVGTMIARARLRNRVQELLVERQRLEAMRDDLTKMLLHDLRTPVNQIALAIDILDEEPHRAGDSDEQRALEIARRGISRLNDMVSNLFDVGRLEGGEMPIHKRATDPAHLVDEVMAANTLTAAHKHITIAARVAPDLTPWLVDPQLFGRVLQNLLGNALKFTPDGGAISILAGLDPLTEEPRIIIEDSGPGIEPDLLPRLFTKFARGKSAGSGTGLGLAFCRLVLEAHGGTIEARNTSSGRAMLTVTLPRP
jgi:signal transduction histidine kinase